MAQTNGGTPDPSASYAKATFKESLEEHSLESLLYMLVGSAVAEPTLTDEYRKRILAKHQSELDRAVKQARIDELLTADDEVRLHNKIDGSYQEWFTKRLAQLEQPIDEPSCLCGLDNQDGLPRMDIVCPKHDEPIKQERK